MGFNTPLALPRALPHLRLPDVLPATSPDLLRVATEAQLRFCPQIRCIAGAASNNAVLQGVARQVHIMFLYSVRDGSGTTYLCCHQRWRENITHVHLSLVCRTHSSVPFLLTISSSESLKLLVAAVFLLWHVVQQYESLAPTNIFLALNSITSSGISEQPWKAYAAFAFPSVLYLANNILYLIGLQVTTPALLHVAILAKVRDLQPFPLDLFPDLLTGCSFHSQQFYITFSFDLKQIEEHGSHF